MKLFFRYLKYKLRTVLAFLFFAGTLAVSFLLFHLPILVYRITARAYFHIVSAEEIRGAS